MSTPMDVSEALGENYNRLPEVKAKLDLKDRLRSTPHVEPESETATRGNDQ